MTLFHSIFDKGEDCDNMRKIKPYLFWSLLFVGLSCSNLSQICRHGFNAIKGFVYKPSLVQATPISFNRTVKNQLGMADGVMPINWQALTDLSFRRKYNKQYQMDILYPIFGNSVRELNHKQLAISGYMIPLNVTEHLYALSRNPYASCFFCGQGGPETVISLKFKKKPRRFKTDEFLTIQGTMELNETNVDDFVYIFRDAEEIR